MNGKNTVGSAMPLSSPYSLSAAALLRPATASRPGSISWLRLRRPAALMRPSDIGQATRQSCSYCARVGRVSSGVPGHEPRVSPSATTAPEACAAASSDASSAGVCPPNAAISKNAVIRRTLCSVNCNTAGSVLPCAYISPCHTALSASGSADGSISASGPASPASPMRRAISGTSGRHIAHSAPAPTPAIIRAARPMRSAPTASPAPRRCAVSREAACGNPLTSGDSSSMPA